MTNQINPTGAQPFVAFENALEVIESLKSVVVIVRRHSPRVAQQIVESASSVAANLAEGSQRVGRDQLYLYRVAAGSSKETRAHLRVALAWGWIEIKDVERTLALLDRSGRLIWGLTR
jgi:four helix bundle protein